MGECDVERGAPLRPLLARWTACPGERGRARGGSLLGLITLLDARPDLDADALADQYAVRMLRGFGLSKSEAARLASRPLPDVGNLT